MLNKNENEIQSHDNIREKSNRFKRWQFLIGLFLFFLFVLIFQRQCNSLVIEQKKINLDSEYRNTINQKIDTNNYTNTPSLK